MSLRRARQTGGKAKCSNVFMSNAGTSDVPAEATSLASMSECDIHFFAGAGLLGLELLLLTATEILKLTPFHLQPHSSLSSTCARHIVVSPYLLSATSGSSEFWGRPEENRLAQVEAWKQLLPMCCRPAHQACGSFCES